MRLVLRAQRGQQGRKGQLGRLELQVQMVLRERQELQELLVLQARPVSGQLEQLVLRAPRASAQRALPV